MLFKVSIKIFIWGRKMNSFRKAVAAVLIAIFIVQIFSFSVIAESPPNKMVNDTGVLQSDQKSTDEKAASSPQIVKDKVPTNTVLTPAAITSSAITSSSITTSQLASDTAVSINSSTTEKVNEKAVTDNAAVTKTKRLIIKYKDAQDTEKKKNSIVNNSKISGLKFKKSINASKFHIYELNDDKNLNNTISELKKDSNVEYVQEDKLLTPLDIPTDTYFSQQWSLQNMGQTVGSQAGTSGVDIDVLKAWDKTKGSPSVVVGVLDTGVDINHEDLKDNIYHNPVDGSTGWNFAEDNNVVYSSPDADKHGTHVSGIIAAAQNGKGVSGVSPNIKILPLKFISNGAGFTSDAISAIEYCKKNNVKIINCSWGSTEENPALKDEMANSGILFICAGGNFGADSALMPVYPADFGLPNIVSVAAVDNTGNLASFSCYGNSVDVAAPGANIISTLPGNSYGLLSGTSMAAPEVTGIAALLLSSDPSMSAVDIANRIKKCVVTSDKLKGKVKSGGRVDALAALEDIIPTSEPGTTPSTTPSSILILNNDQNKSIQDKLKATGENTTPGDNGKILKPLASEDVPSSGESKSVTSSVYEGSVASAVYNGLDTVRNDLNTQSFSALSYIMESEPNNSSSTAMPVSIGTVYGTISSSTDSDWYVVNLDANKQYIINLKGIQQGNDFDLYAFDPNLQDCGMSTNSANSDENITINTTLAGYYYINVAHYIFASSGDHSYQLMIYPNSSQPDSYEPNDSQATAKLITSNTAISANINIPTDEDWYAIDIPSSGKKLTVTMTGVPSGCDYDLSIYNSSSTWIAGSYNNSNANEKTIALISTPGRYYIRVYSYSGYSSSSSYGLTTWVSTPDSYEINGDMNHAKNVAIGNSVIGTIDGPDNEDWYSVTVPNQESLQIGLQHIPQGCDYDLYVYDSSGNSVVASVYGGNTDELIDTQFNQGTYYIRVIPYSGYSEVGQYTLYVSNQAPLTISMPYVKTNSGNAIVVPVNIDNLPLEGVCNFNFVVNYDKTKMAFTGFDAGSLTNTTNADIDANDTENGIVVLYADNSPSLNCPIKTAGNVINLKFQLNSGIPDGAYIFGYNDGWDFGKPTADGGVSEIDQVLFKPGLATTGVYNTYGDYTLTQPEQHPKMIVLDDSAPSIMGDISGNGKIDSTDYSLYKRAFLGIKPFTPEQQKVADFNGDTNYNSTDISYLKRFILEKINYFPVEDIALGKTHVDSDVPNPAYGNDGSNSTIWSASDTNSQHYWLVDLEGKYSITATGITWPSADAYQYKIEVSLDGTASSYHEVVNRQDNTNSKAYIKDVFSAAVDGRYVKVTFTGQGKKANFAEFAVFGTPTNVPTNLTASQTSDTVNLSWTAPSDTSVVSGYNIYKDNVLVGTVAADTTCFSATGLQPFNTYKFTVSSVLTGGSVSAKSTPLPVMFNMILTQDTSIPNDKIILVDGKFTLNQYNIDLNGYKLTIDGSLIQAGGTINVNGGELDVSGDYKIEKEDGNASSGILQMEQSNDCVKVGHDFVMHSTESSTKLTDGILEIKGNFEQKSSGGDPANFSPSNNHKTILDGTAAQSVTFDSLGASMFNLLEINKPLAVYKMPGSTSAQSMSAGEKVMDSSESLPYYKQLLEQYKSLLGNNKNGGVDSATGGYSYRKTDMTVKMTGFNLPVGRSYSSLDTNSNVLGKGWRFSIEGRIDVTDCNGGVRVLTVMVPQGGKEIFVDKGDVNLQADGTRSMLSLDTSINAYILTTKDHYRYAYDANTYKLIWFEDNNGNRISVDYSIDNKRWTYTDVLSRSIVLDSTNPLSITVTDYANNIANRSVVYSYTGKNLSSVTDPEGQKENYNYDLNGLLIQVTDNAGKIVEAVTYKQDSGKTKVDIFTDQLGNRSRYEYDNTKCKTTISDLVDDDVTLTRNYDLNWEYMSSVAYGNHMFVAVGDYGLIKTSVDGHDWKEVGYNNGCNFRDITWNGSKFVAVGDYEMAESDDGITWEYQSNGYRYFNSVTYKGDLFVAVGDGYTASATIVKGNNSPVWTYSTKSQYTLYCVTRNESKFVAVGDNVTATSDDGITWNYKEISKTNHYKLYGVTWDGSKFVAVGDEITATSVDDGLTWVFPDYSHNTTSRYTLYKVIWDGSKFIATGVDDDITATSDDGVTWDCKKAKIGNIAYNGSLYVAVCSNTATSTNGITWSIKQREYSFTDITNNGIMYVAVVGSYYGYGIANSKDGSNWSFVLDCGNYKGVTWNGEEFVAVGYEITATSKDGVTWKTFDQSYSFNSVIWNGDKFVAGVGQGIATSSDGVTWSLKYSGYSIVSIAWDGKKFVGVGYKEISQPDDSITFDGMIVTSTDGGETWICKDNANNYELNRIIWNGSTFVAVGLWASATSPDGTTWSYETNDYEFYSVVWDGSMFIAVGVYHDGIYFSSEIATSKDGLDWNTLYGDALTHVGELHGISWNGNKFIAVGYNTSIVTGIPTYTVTRQTTVTYDKSYNVTEIVDPEKKTTTISYKHNNDDGYGDIDSITDRNGNTTKYDGIDNNGNITHVTNPDLSTRTMEYKDNNRIKEVDENNKYTFYVYDSHNNMTKKVQPILDTVTDYTDGSNPSNYAITNYQYEYDYSIYKEKGLLTQVTDPEGHVTKYTYNTTDCTPLTMAQVGDASDPNDKTTTYHYNSKGFMDWETTPKGYRTDFVYDNMGRLLRTVNNDTVDGSGKSSTTRIVYDSLGRKIQEISPSQYDSSIDGLTHNPQDKKYSDGTVGTKYSYYDNGLLSYVIDAENNTTTYDSYDVYGNLLQKTMPNQSQYKYEYDSMNRITAAYFRDKALDSYGKAMPWTKTEIYAYPDVTNKTPKASSQVVKTQLKFLNDTADLKTTSTYDYAGRLVDQLVEGKLLGSTNSKKVDTSTIYNENGTVKSVTSPAPDYTTGTVTVNYKYDSMNRLIEEDTPFQKDANNNIIYAVKKHYYFKNNSIKSDTITNNDPTLAATVRQTDYDYNSRGLLTKVTTYDPGATPSNYYTQYFYDADGNKVRMYTGLNKALTITGLDTVAANGDTAYSTTKYDYNYLHLTYHITDPLTKVITYGYDPNGNVNAVTDRNNNVITYSYDDNNMLKGKSVDNTSNPAAKASYTYTYMNGNRDTMTGGRSVRYHYDQHGRLDTETEDDGVDEKDYGYYNNSGLRKTFSLKQNENAVTSLTYTYDDLGRLYQAQENGTGAVYTYYNNGSLDTITYSNGNTEHYAYNLANKLTLLVIKYYDTELSKYEYTYYLDGNIKTKKETINGVPKTTTYIYDGLGRLKSESVSGVTISYLYDDYGNRSTLTVTGSSPYSIDYVYDANNMLKYETKKVNGSGSRTTYYYDDNGNQILKGTSTYKYDGFNQLIGVNNDNIKYAYNGDGLRISKTVGGVTTNHLWDGTQIVADVNGTNVTARYVRGTNIIFSEDALGIKKYYLYDDHNVVCLYGDVLKRYSYDAFGNEQNPTSDDTNPFRYSGEYFDKETGTIYLRARYYNPGIGRFMSEDSVPGTDNNPLSLNLYTYCGNNPVYFSDPSGHIMVNGHDYTPEELGYIGSNQTNENLPGDVKETFAEMTSDNDPKQDPSPPKSGFKIPFRIKLVGNGDMSQKNSDGVYEIYVFTEDEWKEAPNALAFATAGTSGVVAEVSEVPMFFEESNAGSKTVYSVSEATKAAVQKILKQPLRNPNNGQFMTKPWTQVNNALKNITTGTKDVTQEVLGLQQAQEELELLKSSSEAGGFMDALEAALKAVAKNKN